MTTRKAPDSPDPSFRAVDETRRELDIEISAEETGREFERTLDDTAARVKLDGFRAGRAPRDIVKRKLSDDIRHSVIDALAPRAVHEALRSRNLTPLQPPLIHDILYDEGGPLRFTASFEVWPDFDLPDIRTVQVRKKREQVEDKDIDQTLESLRQRAAEYTPVEDRGVVDGDYVAAEIKGRDLQTKRFFPTEKSVVMAGHAENEPSLNEHLAGLQPGETRTFQVSYPPDHQNRKLAGKNVEYSLKALSIKARKLPELDDDFARSLGEYAGLEDLKSRVRTDLQTGRDLQARREVADEILQEIANKLALPLPAGVVHHETESLLEEFLTGRSGEPVRVPQADLEKLREEAARRAERKVRNHMILKKIADAESLTVGEDEIDEEIRRLAQTHNIPFPRLRETFDEEGRREELRTSLLLKKAIDFLARSAIIME